MSVRKLSYRVTPEIKMNNNLIGSDSVTFTPGTASTSAAYGTSIGIDYGYAGSYSSTTVKRCVACGWGQMIHSYTTYTERCNRCGYCESQWTKTTMPWQDATQLYPDSEQLKKLMDAMQPQAKVEPVQERIKETKEPMSQSFKEGDKVTTSSQCNSAYTGKVSTIVMEDGSLYIGDTPGNYCSCTESWTLVKEPESMLNPISDLSNLIQRTFSEDTKTLYRAGYLTKDLNVTEKLTNAVGEMFVGHIIAADIEKQTFATFAAELIKRAKEEIEEAEKKEKK